MPAASQSCVHPLSKDPANTAGSRTHSPRRNSRLACAAAARRPPKRTGLRICSPPESHSLAPQSGAAEGRASRILGSLAWRRRSRPAVRAPDARSTPGRRRGGPEGGGKGGWSPLPRGHSTPHSQTRRPPQSFKPSSLRCVRTPEHPEQPQHRWSGKRAEKQGPGRSRHAYLQLLKLPGPVQATCLRDRGSYRPGGLEQKTSPKDFRNNLWKEKKVGCKKGECTGAGARRSRRGQRQADPARLLAWLEILPLSASAPGYFSVCSM